MNRIILLFLLATFIFGQPIQITIPDTHGNAGAICLIPIMIDTVTGREIISVDLTLSFNHQVLNPESVWIGSTVPSSWFLMFNRNIQDTLIIAMAGAYPLSGAGSLCTLQFRVIGSPNDTTTIHFFRCLLNEGNVPCITRDGIFTVGGVAIEDNKIEKALKNLSILPNPFAHIVEIKYYLTTTAKIKLGIYSSSGQEIIALRNGTQKQGWDFMKWNGKNNKGNDCPSGIYFCRLESKEYKVIKKIIKMP